MTEPTVAITDWLLAIETAILAYLLWQRPGRRDLHRWMIGLFLALTVASLAGGLVHAFYTDANTIGHAIFWPMTLISVGATAVCLAVIAARLSLIPAAARRLTVLIFGLFVLFTLVVLFVKQDFVVAIYGYAPAVLYLLVVLIRLWLRSRRQPIMLGIVAIVLTIIASIVQQAPFTIPGVPHANNVLYHIIEGIALVILFKSFKWLAHVG